MNQSHSCRYSIVYKWLAAACNFSAVVIEMLLKKSQSFLPGLLLSSTVRNRLSSPKHHHYNTKQCHFNAYANDSTFIYPSVYMASHFPFNEVSMLLGENHKITDDPQTSPYVIFLVSMTHSTFLSCWKYWLKFGCFFLKL